MATVELSIGALPGHVRTARLVAAAVARRCGVGEGLIDEVKLAVGEACSRAVELHLLHAPEAPVVVQLTEGEHDFSVAVLDCGPPGSETDLPSDPASELPRLLLASSVDSGLDAHGELTEPLPAHLGLAVIAGLVDELSVQRADGQTAVHMRWSLAEAAAAQR